MELKNMKTSKRDLILTVILTIASVGQIISAILLYDPGDSVFLINTGWIVLMFSAVFGWLPILTFRRKGKVKGRGYIHTTVLVSKGIYRIIRHPQYFAGVLIGIALPMITQHLLVAILGLIVVVTNYLNTYDEEKKCIEKFGEEYKQYMENVPRMNFFLGIIRLIKLKLK